MQSTFSTFYTIYSLIYNTPHLSKTDAIRQNKTENFHLLPYLLSHYSFFSLVPHRISLKDTSSIHFLFHIVQTTIISISSNSLALFLKLFQIIDDFASKKCCSIFQCRLVNNYSFPRLSPHLRFRTHRTNTSLPVPEMPSNILRLLLLRYLLLYPDL